jgi:hypothetical protein
LPQHITIKFENPQAIKAIRYVGQGGFCPREVVIWVDGVEVTRNEMGDSNFEQTINLENAVTGSIVKTEFTKASDLFGRIVMYKFEVLG